MKRITLLTVVVLLLITFCSCDLDSLEEVDRVPIDCRFTEAHTEIITEYKHKYSWWEGDWVLVPDTHTVSYPDKYEILYTITYKAGNTDELWVEVDQDTYMAFKGGGEG